MDKFLKNSRELLVKTMEGISSTASKFATTTKYKVAEMDLSNRKHEKLEALSKLSYELWQKGIQFPTEINDMLLEISEIDNKMTELKTQHFAYLNPEVEQELEDKKEVEFVEDKAHGTDFADANSNTVEFNNDFEEHSNKEN